MKTVSGNDRDIAELERFAAGDVRDAAEEVREAAKPGFRAPVVARRQAAIESGCARCAASFARVSSIDERMTKWIEDGIALGGERNEAIRLDADVRRETERERERIDGALRAPGALPRVVLELEKLLEAQNEVRWRGGLPSTWPDAAREEWLSALNAAGVALGELRVQICTPEEIAKVRALLDELSPGRWSARHRDVCRPEAIEPSRPF